MSGLGWTGMAVRHRDGRTGTIKGEFVGFEFAGLTIAVDGGGEAYVEVAHSPPYHGEAGWEWRCDAYDGGPRWLPLGHDAAAGDAAA